MHRGKRVLKTARQEGDIHFNEMEHDVQFDVAACVRDMDERIYKDLDLEHDEVWEILAKLNPSFPILNVRPRLLAACEQRALYHDRVADYEEVWHRGEGEDFPPVVVDTNEDNYVLCEGGHRSCSAANVDAPWLLAVDIAKFDPARVIKARTQLSGRKDWDPRDLKKRRQKIIAEHGEQISDYLDAYLEAALWSSTDESDPETGGEPLDVNYTTQDIAPETMEKMLNDAFAFLEQNHIDIGDRLTEAGHDFWLTRNGHGAGFWDGDWPEPAATRLDEASKKFGEMTLIVGADGKIHAL